MTLFCGETGNKSGKPIVFIHGGGLSSWMWDNQVEFFKNQYYCLTPDLPGHGNSKREEYISTRDCTEKIIEIIETKAKGKKVILVGLSLGAQIVVDILSIRPDLVERTLINSGIVRSFKLLNSMIPLMVKWSIPLAHNRKFARFQAKDMYISDSSFETYYQDTKSLTAKTLSTFMIGYFNYKLPDTFKEMTVPSLVLIGSKEPSIMKKSLIALVKSNPNCKGYIMPDVKHGASLSNPKLFNEVLSAWINKQPLPLEIHEFS
ncbi:alpha/beta fold hydrolase [Clostridium pasteurianum]|uniref:Putative hydrolase or acyltransferase of alpha/beta superfamily n=1 Tax=Clostridium pasteurianum BC1 TaxID=86416 RepID=R4KD55_CLOPA|nr:alpha/beta hydrolase [Clostridium pasteurianum]AGK97535.1 putative hydrolase or acyltransferase of alpha/beta superfamily [Clostridium pasteurianum BC1]